MYYQIDRFETIAFCDFGPPLPALVDECGSSYAEKRR
jgi:hypothetical protein